MTPDELAELRQDIEAERIYHRDRQRRRIASTPGLRTRLTQRRIAQNKARLETRAGRPRPDTCEACGSSADKIVFDHCHNSNTFRGWICDRCNLVIGQASDDPDLLEKLATYVRKHDANNQSSATEVDARDRNGVDPSREGQTE